jgi:O-6-methylguanine DNA methyltransferase
MRCCDVEALWDEMREGVQPRREHVLAHLRGCKTCQHLYEQFEGVAYCLSCLPVVEPPPNLVPRILDHIKSYRERFKTASPDSIAQVPSPLGKLLVAWRESGITFVGIQRRDYEEERRSIERRLHRPVQPASPPDWVKKTVQQWFKTWRADFRYIDVSELTEFERAVLRKAAEIPPGEVRSYAWVAREIGRPQAARAVGQVMARNPIALFLPCHRVVATDGRLHNYGYGLEVKARILRMEGYKLAARRTSSA